MTTNFDTPRSGTGTKEWAEVTENICRGCANNCLYCYAAHNANRFKLRGRGEWQVEELTKRAAMRSYPARGGVVMFLSSHDITPYNLAAYIRVARLILAAGNRLLIVSKARLECIRVLLSELEKWREQILFRFTINSVHDHTSQFWEPGAPLPIERVSCLAMACGDGFATSVSIEPMLAGIHSAIHVVEAVREHVTETIWIGKMNKARLRVDMRVRANSAAVERIEAMQNDMEIINLYLAYRDDPLIRWKDSIKEVVARWWSEVEKVNRIYGGENS